MKSLILIICMALTLVSCSKEEESDQKPTVSNNQLVIMRGDICGWCAKNDTMVMNASKARMRIYESCDILEKDTTTLISNSQWNQIIQKFDAQKFKSLNLNSCAVCYDGCDSWISIKSDTLSHQIRWVKGDTAAIKKVRDFVNELEQVYTSLGG